MYLKKTNLRPTDFHGGYKRTKILELVEEFLDSGEDVMEIADHKYSTTHSGYNSIQMHLMRFGEPVKVHQKNGKLYLVRM